MKNQSTVRKILCVLLIVLLIFPYLSFSAIAISDYSEEQLTETLEVDTTASNLTGNYYITNRVSKRFLCKAEGYSVTTSAFQYAQDVFWKFENVGNNKFGIRWASNPDYALSGMGNYVEIDIMTGTPSFYYAWIIQPAANGGFIITNYGGENVLCYDGTTLSLVSPRSPSDANYDETVWDFVGTDKYILFIDNYYDIGFSVRFFSIDSNSENLIKEYEDAVSERLLSIFGLELLSTYTSYTSSADYCKTETYGGILSNFCDRACVHTNQYHTLSSTFRSGVPNGSSTATTSIWTGHLLANNARSNSYSHYVILSPWLTYTLFQSGNIEQIAVENTYSLIHELSHQIGAPDHYCREDWDQNAEVKKCSNNYCDRCVYGMKDPRSCIMSYRYDISTLTDDNMYCVDCLQRISGHLDAHH